MNNYVVNGATAAVGASTTEKVVSDAESSDHTIVTFWTRLMIFGRPRFLGQPRADLVLKVENFIKALRKSLPANVTATVY